MSPIYDFECLNCRARREILISSHENIADSILCDSCDGVMKKLISAPNLRFNGDGWTTKKAENKDNQNE